MVITQEKRRLLEKLSRDGVIWHLTNVEHLNA